MRIIVINDAKIAEDLLEKRPNFTMIAFDSHRQIVRASYLLEVLLTTYCS
jgi:hypothetical protein